MLSGGDAMMKRMIAAALAALLLSFGAPAQALGPLPEAPIHRGADISVYQGTVDFARLKESGLAILYIRAGFGQTADGRLEENAAGAEAAGLHHGFYFYVTARTEWEARLQARCFAGLLRGKAYDCRPAMDLEDFSGLSVREARAVGLAFLEDLEAETGAVPLLYADAWAASTIWADASFSRFLLWAADYGPEAPDITGDTWRGWAGFQYTDRGSMPGISAAVDLDHFTDAVLLKKGGPEVRTYLVQPGDTLWAIARRYGTTVCAIAEENGIQNPNLIYPGQVLRL